MPRSKSEKHLVMVQLMPLEALQPQETFQYPGCKPDSDRVTEMSYSSPLIRER